MKSNPLLSLVSLVFLASNVYSFSLVQNGRPRMSLPSTTIPIDSAVDPFATYSIANPDQGLAYKDTQMGTGALAEKGKVLVVSYAGRLLSTGKQFDEGQGYAFRLGEGKVMRGWDKGLMGMKVGGKRTLRIPPNLGYGNEGFTFIVPAGAHLEFDCELTSVASNPFEEVFALAYAKRGRLITIALLLLLLAVSPQLG